MNKRSNLLDNDSFNQLSISKEGYCLYNRNDRYMGKSIEKYGESGSLEMKILVQLCAPGDTVIEIGSNIGTHTIGLAKRVGSSGRVLAFEPQRLVFQTLCANVALNSLTNVYCYWSALGSEEGVITVPELNPNQLNNFGGVSLLDDAVEGHQIDCFTLDRYISESRIKLIKIDVEGAEADVLNGGLQLIQKFKPFLYVENDRVKKSEALIKLIDSIGYRMFWHLPPEFNPDNYYADAENIFSDIISVNMLCVHRDNDIKIGGLTEISDFSFHPFL